MTTRKVVAGAAPCPECGAPTRSDGVWLWCSKCPWSDPADDGA